VNAEIRSSQIAGALTIPKEVLRREGNESGVFKVVDDKLGWQKNPFRCGKCHTHSGPGRAD